MRALEQARKARGATPQQQKAQDFLEMMAARPEACWDDLVAEFRRGYYDAFDEIVPALLASDDPFITSNCVRFADLSQPKEVKALQDFIRTCNPEKHQVSLRALAETRVPELVSDLQEKKGLPESVREVLARLPPRRR